MPFNMQNLLAAIGQGSQGFQAQQQQQRELQAKQIAAQRLSQLIAQSTQGQPAGMPQMGGGGMNSPQGGPVPLTLDNSAGQPAGTNMVPGATPSFASAGGAPQGNSDPMSYPNVMSAFFGPQGGTSAADFMAWQDTEKSLRPYGQIQGRSQLETQRETNRESLEDKRQGGRLQLLTQKNAVIMRGQDKNYQARLAAVAARADPKTKAEFDAAKAEFTQASNNYRNAKISMNSTPEDIEKQADIALAAQQKMEAAAAKAGSAATTSPAVAASAGDQQGQPAVTVKVKVKQGEEVRYDDQGNAYVNRNGQAVPAEK